MTTRSSSAAPGDAEPAGAGRGRGAADSAPPPGGLALEIGAAAVVLAYGVLIARVVPDALYVPVNLGTACLAVAALRRFHVSWRDLGLARDRMKSGLRLGALTVIPIAIAVAVGLAIPWTREFFRDATILGASTAEAAYTLLLRIPFGTAAAEELIFRGALLGLYLQRHRPWVAVLMSSVVFGLWHVLPTLNSLGTNPGAAATAGSVVLRVAAVAFVVLATGAAGAFFCLLRLRSGSVLAPWLTHTAFNSLGYLGSRVEGRLTK